MTGTGRMPFYGPDKNHRYFEDDWEAAEELTPDPFSEEEHTRIHGRRFSDGRRNNDLKKRENTQNQEQTEDNQA